MKKPAKTTYPILDAIADRWSPRAFEDRAVEPEKLQQLFEAARWAASAFNEQPWRFMLARKEQPEQFANAISCLVEGNQGWAQHAPVLMLTAISTKFRKNDNPNAVAQHDLGQAAAHLAVQATAMGLVVHQMSGIEHDKVREVYGLPEDYEPMTAIAVGYPGSADQLPEGWARDAEQAPRERLAFDEFVFGDKFGKASGLFD